LKKFLLNRTGNDFEQVEEVLQESFLSLFRHIKSGNKVTHDRGLLFKIAKNQLIDFHRRKFKESMYVSPLETEKKEFPSPKPSYEQILSDEQDLNKLQKIIDCLPTRCREVFMLSRFEGMKHRQIADACGISVSMVEKHLKKAITIIRSRMNN
ncbi:MAG: RNA polymerase sigma factor, partial [Pseudomonadota bacterium]